MATNNQQIEKYEEMDEISHILERPGTWVGSIVSEFIETPIFIPSKNKIQFLKNVEYNAGLFKLIEEILSNSIDEFRSKESLFKISQIDVEVLKNGKITIRDNGGILVDKYHKKRVDLKTGETVLEKTELYIAEKIFGELRSSSNYRDKIQREGVGQNGLGAKLTNIFSSFFNVVTCDGKKKCDVLWNHNMRKKVHCKISDSKEHYTETSFQIELHRFDMTELSVSIIRNIQQKCIVAAATNKGLVINFKTDVEPNSLNSTWMFQSFKDYVKLYFDSVEKSNEIFEFNTKNLSLIVSEKMNNDVACVNGALCCEGTHIKKIQSQITSKIIDYCKSNEMELINEKDILQRLTFYIDCTINNPTYDAQNKLKLAQKLPADALKISDEFLESIVNGNSFIIKILKDFYTIRYAEEKKKELRELNKMIKSAKVNTTKYINTVDEKIKDRELWLFEGTSASNGFRKSRKHNQSAYLCRGKILNTVGMQQSKQLQNAEMFDLYNICNLQFGEPQKNIKNLPFEKIILCADMDMDGNHITGLELAFFVYNFKELIQHKKIYRALSPIIICQHIKSKKKTYFYSYDDFKLKEKEFDSKQYEIRHIKGLGGLENDDYYEMLHHQKLIQFIYNENDLKTIDNWFSKKSKMKAALIFDETTNTELD